MLSAAKTTIQPTSGPQLPKPASSHQGIPSEILEGLASLIDPGPRKGFGSVPVDFLQKMEPKRSKTEPGMSFPSPQNWPKGGKKEQSQ
ncbi:uncharacterized protein PADG_01148 [Paracoccidioides brasiliensis Pb18]|uniref:Uncharacterized protein n=1 Tax=Paracoccidioides brasiliensis (strain Pb18) TaxID=502780 RepID=C1FZC2_PARBD|nr:uncharacterized protein PADG_01148 [Paracoccidioides brasiliensis Pb18]EEH44859.2 hypothetical protein PADG_01148 [Paracoccidioides brasiliensis Pb18]